jgi:hypothetical protein
MRRYLRAQVRRYLEIFDSTGAVPSELFRRKAAAGAAWRFDRSCLLWLDADRDVLGTSLDARVQQMLERGLLREVAPLLRRPGGFSRGLAQAIGVREFAPLFRCSQGGAEKDTDGGGEGAVDDDGANGSAGADAADGSGDGDGDGGGHSHNVPDKLIQEVRCPLGGQCHLICLQLK